MKKMKSEYLWNNLRKKERRNISLLELIFKPNLAT